MSTINEHLRHMKEVQDLFLQDSGITMIETCSDESETEDYNLTIANDEKAYVCDYDTIYVCLYEELEEYRTSKQAKKNNTTNFWDNLIVVMPDGAITDMQNAPRRISKEATKLMTDEKKPDTKIEGFKGFKVELNVQESSKQKTNNSNNVTHSHVPEVKVTKIGPVQSKKQKLSKKKLKKQRQKEKKKRKESKEKDQEEEAEEENDDEESEDVITMSRSESKAESLESAQDEVNDQESEDNSQAFVDIDLSDEMAFSSAFVCNVLKKNKKKILIKKEEKAVKTSNLTKANKKAVASIEQKSVEKKTALPSKSKATPDIASVSVQPSVDPDFDFTVKKNKRPKASGNEYQEAISLGKEAIKLILSDNISPAVQFLSKAIQYNSYDLRHFLNRSFCYLRLGAYNLALKDAQVVIKYTNERDELVKAKFRSGQALCGLQNFEEAEKQLNEAYNFSQVDLHIQRELMRVRILQLLYMGFRERDILDAFKERSSVADVVSILTENTSVDKDDDYSNGNECAVDIYNSDDEENPSFTRILSKMLKYQPGVSKKVSILPSNPSRFMNPIQTATGPYRNPVVTEAKKIINTVVPKLVVSNKGLVNDKAIWVGNTTSDVTDNMLRKKFTRYGKIISIYRKPNESYTFINFESAKAVTELLTSIAQTQSVEVEGHKLLVKAATRAK